MEIIYIFIYISHDAQYINGNTLLNVLFFYVSEIGSPFERGLSGGIKEHKSYIVYILN